jgi:hypothetical protein
MSQPSTEHTTIPGYDFGRPDVPRSPVSLDELRQLEATVGWTDADADVLRRAGPTLEARAEQLVDAWRARIGAQAHLARWFFGPEGQPDNDYKARVKRRFVQWVIDTCVRPHDQAWLDYQDEIGQRHTPAKKNLTDGAHTPPVVPLRHLIGFGAIVIATAREFVDRDAFTDRELFRFQDAWTKAVLLQIALWSRPYTRADLW